MLKTGQLVEVLSKEEILKTLDKQGRLEGMPFMPGMFKYCGKRFKVYSNAYKSCDTASGRYIGLSVKDAIHLNLRCDGEAFEGCQAGCLIYWKEAWLKPVSEGSGAQAANGQADAIAPAQPASNSTCTYEDVLANTYNEEGGEKIYKCQATTLLEYTTPLKWWNARQYWTAYASGNRSIPEILRGMTYLAYAYGTRANHPKYGAAQRWLYDRARGLWGGIQFPRREGLVPPGQKTPRVDLNLQPGEYVRVKPYEDILKTLDKSYGNRGMKFDAEIIPYCGQVLRVKRQVTKFVDEANGKVKTLKTPAVILDGAVCQSKYSGQRMFCPREIYIWWREIWLERVENREMSDRPENDNIGLKTAAE